MVAHDAALLVESQVFVVRMWRARLLVVLVLFGLGAAVSTAIAIGYREPILIPALMWVGTGCVYMTRRAIPGPIISINRPSVGASAAWAVAAIASYVVIPVMLHQTSVLPG